MKTRLQYIWPIAALFCTGVLANGLRDALSHGTSDDHQFAQSDETLGEQLPLLQSVEEMTNTASATLETKTIRRVQQVSTPFSISNANAIARPSPPVKPPTRAPQKPNATTRAFIPADPELELVASDGKPASAFPLSQCEGQCIYDDDCRGKLKCFKVFQPDPAVPGCSGVPVPGKGYCFNLSDYPPDKPSNATGFRMKLYWESGYFWQGETFDRRWCALCGLYCVTRFCNDAGVTRFQFIFNKNGTQIKDLQTKFCFERYRKQYVIERECNATKPTQWFTGTFNSSKFEIHPYGMPKMCVGQTHHPKIGELLYIQDCPSSRASTTSYWMKY